MEWVESARMNMRVINTLDADTLLDQTSIEGYWNSQLIEDLYFSPKSVAPARKEAATHDSTYIQKVNKLVEFMRGYQLDVLCGQLIASFEQDTGYCVSNQTLYLILGCNTTTIYTTELNSETVSVLCMESIDGDLDTMKMYLAHEFTHFIRKQLLQKDIFESCIGERFVTEGIAENYSREIVPDKLESSYCIVEESTVAWVRNHLEEMDEFVKDKLDNGSLMEDLFYMYADIDYPVRTGYVYGYLAVKHYLQKNTLSVKDIISIDWHRLMEDIKL